jgi:uncharacterized protein YxjI
VYEDPSAGPGRYLVREKVFAIGDDFWVTTENGQKVVLVDGKALRLRDTLELKDVNGGVLLTVKRKVVTIHHSMKIEDAAGATVAEVRKKKFTLFRDRFVVELAGGEEWQVTGNLIDKEYGVTGPNGPVAQVSNKWFRVRDTYGIDVAPGVDHVLAIAVAVCVDRLSDDSED